MDSTSLLALFRSEVRDEVEHYLWSDTEVLGYIDDAQKMFCRLTNGIMDSVSALTSIEVTTGDTFVAYSDKILSIVRGYREIDKQPLTIINDDELEGNESILTESPGRTRILVVGMDASNLRLIPEADDDDTLHLSVRRLPLNNISAVDQALEIQEKHHRHLLLWVKSLAHSKMDAETFNSAKASEFEDAFRKYCTSAESEEGKRSHRRRTVRFCQL